MSPTQVNAQVPDGIPIGSGVPLVLSNANGQSEAYVVQTNDLAPALLAPDSFSVNGKRYVVATFPASDANGVVYVGPTGAIPGVSMHPAVAGDVITLYGIGFGKVSPGAGAGVIATQATSVTNPVTLRLGQTSAAILYGGLAPGFVGLYQFNVQVPSVAARDWPLTLETGGTTGSQTIYIATQ